MEYEDMDVLDYNSRLTSLREDYSDKFKEIRNSHKEDVDNIEKAHQHQVKQKSKAYNEGIRKIERDSERIHREQTQNNQEEVRDLKKDFRERIVADKKMFEEKASKNRKEFTERFESIKSDYDENVKNEKFKNNDNLYNRERFYENKIERNAKNNHEELINLQKKNDKSFKNFKEFSAKETKDLLLGKDDQMNKQSQEFITDKNDLVARYRGALDGKDQSNKERIEQLNLRNNSRLTDMRNRNLSNMTDLRANFEDKMDEMTKKNRDFVNSMKEESKRKFLTQEKGHRNLLNMERRRAEEISKTSAGGLSPKEALARAERGFQRKANKIKKVLQDERYRFKIDQERGQQNSQELIAEKKQGHRNEMEQKNQEFSKTITGLANRSRFEKEQVRDNLLNDLSTTKSKANLTIMELNNKAKRKFLRRTGELSKQIKGLQDKNVETISRIQKDHATEKTKFLESNKKLLVNEKQKLRDQMQEKFIQEKSQMIDKITYLEKEKKGLINQFENYFHQMRKRSSESLRQQKAMSEDQKIVSTRNFKKALGKNMRETQKVIDSLRKQFNQRLLQEKNDREQDLTLTTDKYEKRIKLLRQDNKKILNELARENSNNLESLLRSSDAEKARISSTYEVKLDKLKKIHDNERELWESRFSELKKGNIS